MVALLLVLSLSDVEGKAVLESVVSRMAPFKGQAIGVLTSKVGLQLVGRPYVSATLERSIDREDCFVTFQGFDCVTFYESALAVARVIKKDVSVSSSNIVNEISHLRYRSGKLDGYLSRLHYSTDWFDDCVKKGLATWVPGTSETFKPNLYFMSKNSRLYPQLKAHPNWVPDIENRERALSQRSFPWISKAAIKRSEKLLKTGDIVAITTSVAGLDCSHTGMIVVDKGSARFLHASSELKKVTLGPSVSEYVASHRNATGILAIRPSEP